MAWLYVPKAETGLMAAKYAVHGDFQRSFDSAITLHDCSALRVGTFSITLR